ncbi:MAG: sensor histidine kinase [Lysobacterales bacterium]
MSIDNTDIIQSEISEPAVGIRLRPMTLRIVLVVVACWMVIGGLYLSSVVLNAQKYGQPFTLSLRVLIGTQLIYLGWAAFNLLMMAGVRQLSGRPSSGRYLAGLAAIGLLWIPVNLWLDATISDWIFHKASRSAQEIFAQTNFFSVFFVVMLYLTVLFSSLGWTFIERWQAAREQTLRLEQQRVADRLEMSDLRMQILKSQLSPHFLFNALGSISGLIRSDTPQRANSAIQTLGDMLRFALSTGEEPLIHFSQEREFTENYLALQSLRFADRFTCTIHAESLPMDVTCPPFVLQTLIENAFVHGVERRDQPTAIDATIAVSGNALQFSVRNEVGDNRGGNSGNGLALDNLRKRLQLLFDEKASVRGTMGEKVYEATVSLPLVKTLA